MQLISIYTQPWVGVFYSNSLNAFPVYNQPKESFALGSRLGAAHLLNLAAHLHPLFDEVMPILAFVGISV